MYTVSGEKIKRQSVGSPCTNIIAYDDHQVARTHTNGRHTAFTRTTLYNNIIIHKHYTKPCFIIPSQCAVQPDGI